MDSKYSVKKISVFYSKKYWQLNWAPVLFTVN